MKCGNCGAELKEGHLYCEVCGYEVRIVPDFEPEIENSITETLETLVGDISEEAAAVPEKKKKPVHKTSIPFWAAFTGISCALVLGGLLIALNRMNSYEYQKEKAVSYAQKQDYEQAISCISRAIALEEENTEARLLLADFYLASGSTESARNVLKELIAASPENVMAYRKLLGIYEKEGDYKAINEQLKTCSVTEILEQFGKYAAFPPEFGYPEGSYSEVIALKLSTNAAGTIYYTLDGSEPTINSQKYTAPLMLENGDYVVKVFFVNEYGIPSDCVTKEYHISVAIPLAPEVSVYSGSYTEPTMIEVKIPAESTVYYTMDGSTPTMDSILYAMPIAMPMGKSTFKFVAYSPDGVAGEVTTRTFYLEVATGITAADAVNSLVLELKERGVLLEADGTLPGKAGFNIYIVSTIVDIGGIDFYLVAEYYEDTIGTRTRTGNLYGVDANAGTLFKITADERGNYFASPL